MSKLRELLLTAVFVALVVIGLRALERLSSRPLIYIEGTFPTYIADEGWMYVVRSRWMGCRRRCSLQVKGEPCASSPTSAVWGLSSMTPLRLRV